MNKIAKILLGVLGGIIFTILAFGIAIGIIIGLDYLGTNGEIGNILFRIIQLFVLLFFIGITGAFGYFSTMDIIEKFRGKEE